MNAEESDTDALIATLSAVDDPRTLGRYELLLPLGRGGMAVVWAARLRGMRGFSKIVALKTVLPALTTSPRAQRMFLAEADIASKIKHPNVCEIFDLGEDQGVMYLVMEWIDGEALSTLARACREAGDAVPHGVAARIVAGAARGLDAAHRLRDEAGKPYGVVHRDVSPQNILVSAEGAVKIVDFGVAKLTQRAQELTESGVIKGKVAYLAPEQVQKRDIDARADVFALGVVLYELATGAHPFKRETDLATLLEIASPDPAPPADVPEELAKILARALAKDPNERYPAMVDMARDLEAFAASVGCEDDAIAAFVGPRLAPLRAARAEELRRAARDADQRPPRPAAVGATTDAAIAAPPSKPEPRSRSPLWTAAGVLVVGVAIGAVGLRASQSVRPEREASPAPSASTSATAASTATAPTQAATATVTTTPPAPTASAVEAPSRPTATVARPSAPVARAVGPSSSPSASAPPSPPPTATPAPVASASTPTVIRRPDF